MKNVNTTGSLTDFQFSKQVSIVLCMPSNGALKSLIRNWWQVATCFVLWYPSFAAFSLLPVSSQINGTTLFILTVVP